MTTSGEPASAGSDLTVGWTTDTEVTKSFFTPKLSASKEISLLSNKPKYYPL